MKTNITKPIDEEVRFFCEKFKEIGWKQEDVGYLIKDIGFTTYPDSRNEEWKTSIGITIYPELLSYYSDEQRHRGFGWIYEIWLAVRTTVNIDENVDNQQDGEILRNVADYLLSEIEKIGWKSFKDEDAFKGYFSRPEINKNLGSVSINCYLNKSYPNGYWSNHTL